MFQCELFIVKLIGWLVFNGTFSTNRLYQAIYAQEINPNPITYLPQTDGRTSNVSIRPHRWTVIINKCKKTVVYLQLITAK